MPASEAATDSAALLSTCAGAGATMVAIVGGLLVSRYIGLEAEKGALRKRVELLEPKVALAQSNSALSARKLSAYYVERALDDDDVLDIFLNSSRESEESVEAHCEALLEAVKAETVMQDLDLEILALRVAALEQAAWEISQFDWEVVPRTNRHDYWEVFAKKNSLAPSDCDDLWERKYTRVCRARPAPPSGRGFSEIDYAVNMVNPASWADGLRDMRNRLVDAAARDSGDLQRLESELAEARKAEASHVQPKGLLAGLLVLVFMTITSVIIPILYLAPVPARLSTGEMFWVLGAAGTGLLALFAFLSVHLRGIWHQPAHPNTPTGHTLNPPAAD